MSQSPVSSLAGFQGRGAFVEDSHLTDHARGPLPRLPRLPATAAAPAALVASVALLVRRRAAGPCFILPWLCHILIMYCPVSRGKPELHAQPSTSTHSLRTLEIHKGLQNDTQHSIILGRGSRPSESHFSVRQTDKTLQPQIIALQSRQMEEGPEWHLAIPRVASNASIPPNLLCHSQG